MHRLLIAFLFITLFTVTSFASTMTFTSQAPYGQSFNVANKDTSISGVGVTSLFDFTVNGKAMTSSDRWTFNGWTQSFGDTTVKTGGQTYFVPAGTQGNFITTASAEFTTKDIGISNKIFIPFTAVANFSHAVPYARAFGFTGIASISFNARRQIIGITTRDSSGSTSTSSARMASAFDESVPTPEPITMVLFGTGLAGIAARIRKRRQA